MAGRETGRASTPRVGYSAAQIRAAERPLLERGVPLMCRAAAGLAEQIRLVLRMRPGPVLLLVGSGDNGGDALHAGAELAESGERVLAVRLGSRVHAEGWDRAQRAGVVEVAVGAADGHAAAPDRESPDQSSRAERIAEAAVAAAVIVDGIVGIGARGPLRGAAREAVQALLPIVRAPDGPAVVAVDLPSGLDPDTGRPADDMLLPADITVTFGGCKAGLLLPPGDTIAGRVVLIDIGIAAALAGEEPVVSREN